MPPIPGIEEGPSHNFGPRCDWSPVDGLEPPRGEGLDDIPPIRAQFFYSSPIPIDEPLSTDSDFKPTKAPLRPFSTVDNNALERAWLSLVSDQDRESHRHVLRSGTPGLSLTRADAERLAAVVEGLVLKHKEKHEYEAQARSAAGGAADPELSGSLVCCAELPLDTSAALRQGFCALTRKRQPTLDQDRVVGAVMDRLNRLEPEGSAPTARCRSASLTYESLLRDASLPPISQSVGSKRSTQHSTEPDVGGAAADNLRIPAAMNPGRPLMPDDGISGKPFVRVETEGTSRSSTPASFPRSGSEADGPGLARSHDTRRKREDSVRCRTASVGRVGLLRESVEIAVGVSRLHMVSLPVLQMKPIYWSPVNDMSVVTRATWFYRDSMAPVEAAVANQLETGYRELKPWTQTWRDEVRSATDVGPLGEEKVAYPLWPDPSLVGKRSKSKDACAPEPSISSDPFCAARCFRGEAAYEGTLEPVHPDGKSAMPNPEMQAFAGYQVLYKDGDVAFLLKPSLQPSAYYGRKPLSKIMKGATVGIPLVRGFDRRDWDRINHKRGARPKTRVPDQSEDPREQPVGGVLEDCPTCPACEYERASVRVTDLCLVAHGIGQKFAERVESFHFTHAVNGFRRAVTTELRSAAVRPVLREGQGGIMILPINWRHVLSFEDGGPMQDQDKAAYAPEGFGLKDIEPNSIKSVRSLISDVMFDIPFYMSHHKPKMIAALVGEANRVYRLWCHNNPGFAQSGRVHLVGHSLGSAMAIEILSKQPSVPRPLDLTLGTPGTTQFEFNVTNLFLLGSPAAFFLLLERGCLLPRRGRMKPGADAGDTVARDVVGDAGMFGCLAVDNIYNILAKEDPIAYLLNGTIDPVYSASLRQAYVPSTASSLFKSVGEAMRGVVGATGSADTTVAALKRPPTARLPSQLELEVHDFTREEIAEKKAFLLNDNGQVDYFLRSGGGPLEIQYLNMLSAHTTYWTNQDLIRLICVEIGRKPGKENTLPSMRATKLTKRPVGGNR